MIRIGIIGVGYWGPNLVRCLQESPECDVVYVCDRDEKKLKHVCDRFPQIIGTADDAEVLRRDRVDAVVIATPTKTHYRLAKRALEAGLHTFVEKPLATRSEECADLIDFAEANGRVVRWSCVSLLRGSCQAQRDRFERRIRGDLLYQLHAPQFRPGSPRRERTLGPVPHDTSIILELDGSVTDQRVLLGPCLP